MENHSRSLRRQQREGKKPIQKPLCRLCECPTSDGHVLASQVDRFKLRKWAMKAMNLTEENENLPEVVGEDALICYFCIWQAEFGDESGDEAVAWWPKNLELEENAKVLRENYSVGEVEQCWVQLEEVELAKNTKEIAKKRKYVSGVCLYCSKRYNDLRQHVRRQHKEAIKCGIRDCTTYFHTEEEKEQHMQNYCYKKHSKPSESTEIRCKFCEDVNIFSSWTTWRKHMKRYHPELSVACRHHGCKEYFKSKPKMVLHVNSIHKQDINQVLFQCKHCEYFTTLEYNLRKHEQSRHKPKIFKCDNCDAKFGSKVLVNSHYKQYHTFYRCKSCGQDEALKYKAPHREPSVCSRCKLRFECLGLYQSHRKGCKQTLLSCKECGKQFPLPCRLNLHVRRVHTKTEIFHCEHCDYSACEKSNMREHLRRKHVPKTVKCDECDKWFASESFLKIHKQRWHKYVRCAECAQEICHETMLKHRTAKTCCHCDCKLKCSGLLQKHKKSCNPTLLNLSCKECGKTFNKCWKLNCHVKQVHNKSAIFLCDHCDFSTFNKSLMERHIQIVHFP
ncbi:oocyte zinc finger protein XlCOF6-like [Cloeon dipterum]|uniref:oocyte zinc finger protein XlCOF6-like n=1 Tax=Cloeon dipterum TaxID=197152 RepID=UPI00321FD785